MTLGETGAVGAEHEREVGVARDAQAQRARQQDLARRAGEQVIAAEHLADALRVVVDHHGEMVGGTLGGPVAPPQHEVIDDPAAGTGQRILETDVLRLRGESPGHRAPAAARAARSRRESERQVPG